MPEDPKEFGAQNVPVLIINQRGANFEVVDAVSPGSLWVQFLRLGKSLENTSNMFVNKLKNLRKHMEQKGLL